MVDFKIMKYWSLKDVPKYTPVFSIFIYILFYIDKVLNFIFNVNNIIGGDLYELMNKGIFPFIIELVKNHQNYKIIPIRFCTKKMVVINDINIMRQILTRKGIERGSNYERLSEFFGYGIFTSKNREQWKHQRNIIIHLLSSKNLRNSEKAFFNKTIEIIESIKGQTVDLSRLLSKIGLILFCDVVLGIDVSDIAGDIIVGNNNQWSLSEDIDKTLEYINGAVEPIANKFSPKYRKFVYHKTRVHTWMREILNRIKAKHKYQNSDCIPLSESYQNIISNNILIDEFIYGDNITDEMVELLISVILGGHETTSRLMLGIAHSIILNPSIIQKIRDESIISDDGFNSRKVSYINCVINEGLRLFPPVWLISREHRENLFYDNIVISKNTPILLSPLIIQRDKKFWGDDAEIFKPERFENFTGSSNFFPFIVGPESCPGKHFAKLEAMVVIQTLFKYYNIEIIGEHKLNPHSMGTFRLTKDLPVKITNAPV